MALCCGWLFLSYALSASIYRLSWINFSSTPFSNMLITLVSLKLWLILFPLMFASLHIHLTIVFKVFLPIEDISIYQGPS